MSSNSSLAFSFMLVFRINIYPLQIGCNCRCYHYGLFFFCMKYSALTNNTILTFPINNSQTFSSVLLMYHWSKIIGNFKLLWIMVSFWIVILVFFTCIWSNKHWRLAGFRTYASTSLRCCWMWIALREWSQSLVLSWPPPHAIINIWTASEPALSSLTQNLLKLLTDVSPFIHTYIRSRSYSDAVLPCWT